MANGYQRCAGGGYKRTASGAAKGCGCGFPPETCGACVNSCYRIAGYADGDFTPLPGTPSCATAYGSVGVACNGVGLGSVWDGSFPSVATIIPAPNLVCRWSGTCDNTATGDVINRNACISGALLGFSPSVVLQRQCNAVGAVTQKLCSITYQSPTGNVILWVGTASLATPEMIGVYTRTGGDDTTATVTIEHCS